MKLILNLFKNKNVITPLSINETRLPFELRLSNRCPQILNVCDVSEKRTPCAVGFETSIKICSFQLPDTVKQKNWVVFLGLLRLEQMYVTYAMYAAYVETYPTYATFAMDF